MNVISWSHWIQNILKDAWVGPREARTDNTSKVEAGESGGVGKIPKIKMVEGNEAVLSCSPSQMHLPGSVADKSLLDLAEP